MREEGRTVGRRDRGTEDRKDRGGEGRKEGVRRSTEAGS